MQKTIIAMSDNEYDRLKRDLEACQSEFISEIDDCISCIKKLNSKTGGFYAENVTANINALTNSIKKIKKTIITMHTAEKTVISSFAKTIDNYDKCS